MKSQAFQMNVFAMQKNTGHVWKQQLKSSSRIPHVLYQSYVSIHSFSCFFFHIFSPLPSPGLVFQFGLDLRCRSKCLEAKLYHRLRLSNSQQRQEMLENLSQVGGWENLTRKNDGTWWKSRFMKFGTPYFHPKNRGIQMFNQQLKLGMQDPRSCSCDLFAELFHLILRWMPVAWY